MAVSHNKFRDTVRSNIMSKNNANTAVADKTEEELAQDKLISDALDESDSIGDPEPGKSDLPPTDNSVIGNVNGTEQEKESEPLPNVTALSTLEIDEEKLIEKLEELQKRKCVARLQDNVVDFLNVGINAGLLVVENLEGDENITLVFDFEANKFRFGTTTGKILTVSKVESVSSGEGRSREWFVWIAKDNKKHELTMKTPTTNDLDEMEKITGINFKKDKNGNSFSTKGKMGLLKSEGWKYETDNNNK